MFNQDNDVESSETPSILTIVSSMVKLMIIVIGLGIALFGIKYTYDIFSVIYDFLQKPESLTPIIEKWAVLLNIKGLEVNIYPLDKIVTLTILAIGVLLLLRITLGFIHAGVSILNTVANINTPINSKTMNSRVIGNLDYKLNKLKKMAEQGEISNDAYQKTCDQYLIQKIMEN